LAIKVKRIAVQLSLIESKLKGSPKLVLLVEYKRTTQTQLQLVGLKLAIANLVMEIIGCNTPLFPFRICRNCCSLKGNTDAAPLCAVVGREAEVFFEMASVSRVKKDGVVVELGPMDVLGKHWGRQQ
jgi:hypothetical protein